MEEKLKEFKSRRRRKMLWEANKNFFRTLIDKILFRSSNTLEDIEIERKSFFLKNSNPQSLPVEEINERSTSSNTSIENMAFSMSFFQIIIYLLYFMLWMILYFIAIHLEFGFVYLVLSGLFFIFFNTRTGPKKQGEISAYSVFNPGCKAIEGTLKPEQLEREFNLIQH